MSKEIMYDEVTMTSLEQNGRWYSVYKQGIPIVTNVNSHEGIRQFYRVVRENKPKKEVNNG